MATTESHGRHVQRYRRRAASYVYFLSVTLLVMVIGMSALLYARVRFKTAQGGDESIAARFHAMSALELGYAEIHRDLDWRTNRGSGTWYDDRSIGTGKLSLEVTILTDADSDPDNNPATLVGTGVAGSTTHVLEVTLGSLSERGGLAVTSGSGKRGTTTAK